MPKLFLQHLDTGYQMEALCVPGEEVSWVKTWTVLKINRKNVFVPAYCNANKINVA
jgi:hypothetical protein